MNDLELDIIYRCINARENSDEDSIAMTISSDQDLVVDVANSRMCDWTMLMSASATGLLKVTSLLLKRGARVDLQNNWGWSALICASRFNHPHIASLLINEGHASVNIYNDCGWTPLHYACYYDQIGLCTLLIENGAEFSERNQLSHSTIDYLGKHREHNPPTHPLPPLNEIERDERRQRLLTAREAYLTKKRHDANWHRRSPFVHFLRGCGFRLSALQLLERGVLSLTFDTSTPLPPVSRNTKDKNWSFIAGQVFTITSEQIASFL